MALADVVAFAVEVANVITTTGKVYNAFHSRKTDFLAIGSKMLVRR